MSESNGPVSDWIRQGECNQCGDCCRQATNCVSLLVPIQDEAYGRVRFGAPTSRAASLRGVPIFEIRGPLLSPCQKLDGDRCGIHETKPQYCKDTPLAPEDIDGLPRCSFYFKHRKTGEIRAASVGMLAAITFAEQKLTRLMRGADESVPMGIVQHSRISEAEEETLP